MSASILVLIYRIMVIFIGVSLLAYRQMVRYNSKNIILQVVEAKKGCRGKKSMDISDIMGNLPIFRDL